MIFKRKPVFGQPTKVEIGSVFSSKIKAFKYGAVLKKMIAERQKQIADLNTLQLEKGLDSEGRDLGVYKVFSYKNRFRPVDLKDTGAFHKSIKPVPHANKFEMVATDEKADALQDKYGDAILGLSDQDKQFLIDDIRQEFLAEGRKTILK